MLEMCSEPEIVAENGGMLSRLHGSALLGIALAIGGVVLVVAILVGIRPIGAQDGEAGVPATVDYFSGTTHYAVPANYHPGITRYSEKRHYSALDLMLFLPDLSPAADHPEEMTRVGWHDQMTLLFEHGPRWGTADEQIAWMTNWPRGVHTSPEPAVNGCDLYRTPRMEGDVYVCPEDGSKLVLSCYRKSDVPSPSCAVFENVSPDLSLIYRYSAKDVVDAVSIDRRVGALIADLARPQHSTNR